MAAYSSDPTTMASPLTAGPVGFAPSKYSHSRTQSVSSDRPSTIAHSLMSAPLAVSPEAAFVAASAASQIVTNDHDAHSETWYDQVGIEPSGETALVSTGALQLANSFIDHILFNIIATAKSTRLSSLRPAVGEVLKPKLAQDAVNNADEELREYLGGGDIEDLESAIPAAAGRDWDLELAWKRTRLRCMVYSSLGDMEEEDEDYYMEQEHLRGNGDDILSETVSPAVAIFLTSILEFMGEQVLVVSGQAAFNRLRLKYEKELKDGSRSPGEIADRIVVDELDMERVALDRTFGRLWRAWKKKMRSPTEQNFSRPFSRNSFGASQNRRDSGATDNFASPIVSNGDIDPVSNLVVERTPENNKAAEPVPEPTEIALPLSPRDIDEIEIPGLVFYSDDELSDEDEYDFVQAPRPNSMVIWPPRPTWKEADDGVVGDVELAQADEEDEETKLSEPEMNRDGLATGIAPPMHPLTSGEPDTIKAGGNEAQYTGVTSHGDTTSNPEVVSEVAADLAVAPHVNRVHHRSRPRARSQPGSSRRRRYSPVTKEISDAGDFEKPTLANEQEPIASEHSAATEISPEAVEGAEHASAVKVIGSAITASAVGGAVAAIALTNTGRAPSTRSGKDIADELDEEPQIMTSSRVSVYGAPEGAIPSPGLPRRTSSIRSARIIDVPSRSPTTLSRTSSIDAMERSTSRGPPVNAAAAALRSPRMPTPPIAEEPSSSHTRGVLAPIDPRDVTQLGAPPKRTRPSNSSAPQQAASYPAPIKTSMTSPLVVEEDERSGPASYMRRSPLPTLPERNASRPNHQAQPNKVSPESPKPPRHVVAEPPVPASSKLRTTVRGSEENTASSAAPAPAPRAQNMARDFEELMNSDQTLQYTLTPENMRDISASSTENSIGVGSKGRRSEDAKFVERSRSSSVQRSASVSKTNGLNSHPVPESSSAGKLNGPVPRAGQYSPTKARVTASSQQARDARVPRESMQDFAAFIRSTGPPADQAPLKRVGTGGSTTGFRQSSSPVTSSKDMNHGRTESASRIRQTARDPTVTESDSADLADFLRRGPPPANGSGARVQRQAIPPRSAPDYDYHPSAPIRNSEASTTFTEASVPSSLNSSSALLGRNKPAQPSNNFDDGEMMPQRKQRRVRDPYAIDFSDEDDDEELFADVPQPKTKPKQEESLIDFLKNYEPPPEPVSAPVMTPPTLPKKRSASNLMARLRSNGHSSSGSISGKQSSKPSVEPRPPNTAPSGTSRGYTPITVNIPPDSDKLGSFFEAPAPRPPQSSGRVPMKKFEPRDAASSSTRTNDLAAFLRDSEPPPSAPPVQRPGRSESQQSSSGFSRVFDRRKKTSGF